MSSLKMVSVRSFRVLDERYVLVVRLVPILRGFTTTIQRHGCILLQR
jgi:hypothetical protein